MKVLRAHYGGTCRHCFDDFTAGELIARRGDGQLCHAVCIASPDQIAPPAEDYSDMPGHVTWQTRDLSNKEVDAYQSVVRDKESGEVGWGFGSSRKTSRKAALSVLRKRRVG